MNAKTFFHIALVGMLIGLGATRAVEARAFLVIGETDELWAIDPNLSVETRGWIEAGARRLESTHPQERGFVLVDTSGTYIAPFFVEPDFNLSLGYEARGGWGRTKLQGSTFATTKFDWALDGDLDTFYFYAGKGSRDHQPTVNLGGIFPINRILFYAHPERLEQYADSFSLYVNDGDPAQIDSRGLPIWEEIRNETENKVPVVETVFPTRPVRYVSLKPQWLTTTAGARIPPKSWEISEFEIYGEGYVPKATYISEIIDISQVLPELVGDQASWGRLHWIGHKDEEARVAIRTRTGNDEDPNVYWWDTGRGDELSSLSVDGKPLTLKDYLKISRPQRRPTTPDVENWSFWSPPYDFDQGVEGVPIASPGPRHYIQFRIDFSSTITSGSRIESIGFDFSKPPSAQAAIAEIFPREVEAAVDTTFTYFLLPILADTDMGFDSLEIETFVRPSGVRSVRMLSDIIVEIDTTAYRPEILEDRLIVHFPRFEAEDTRKLLEVVFDVKVVKYGTEFRGRIFDQHSDEVRQLVEGGDATKAYSGGGVAVTIPLSEQLISSVEVRPELFTPNGDGINDQTIISYAVLNLTETAEASLIIYDLSGRQVRKLQTEPHLSDIYRWPWNGQTDDGSFAPPGNYIYRISVKTDNSSEHQSGVISVAY